MKVTEDSRHTRCPQYANYGYRKPVRRDMEGTAMRHRFIAGAMKPFGIRLWWQSHNSEYTQKC